VETEVIGGRRILCDGTASPEDLRACRSGLSRQERRRFKKLIERAGDKCTLCRKPLGTGTYTGRRRGRAEYVSECCVDRLDLIDGVGFFVSLSPGDADRIWFEQNPRRSHRIRRALEGEFAGTDATWAIIRQLEPGIRHRRGFKLPDGAVLPNDEATAHVLFDALSDAAVAGETQFPIGRLAERLAAAPHGGRA
jgi:hypothetical protein